MFTQDYISPVKLSDIIYITAEYCEEYCDIIKLAYNPRLSDLLPLNGHIQMLILILCSVAVWRDIDKSFASKIYWCEKAQETMNGPS